MSTCKRCGGSGEEPNTKPMYVRWPDGSKPDCANDPRWKRLNYIDSQGHPVLYPEPVETHHGLRVIPSTEEQTL